MYEDIAVEQPDGSKQVTITRLRKLVLSSGLPAYSIAAQAGIHHSQMTLYMSGERDLKVEHLANLVNVLGVPADQITGKEQFLVHPDNTITPVNSIT